MGETEKRSKVYFTDFRNEAAEADPEGGHRKH